MNRAWVCACGACGLRFAASALAGGVCGDCRAKAAEVEARAEGDAGSIAPASASSPPPLPSPSRIGRRLTQALRDAVVAEAGDAGALSEIARKLGVSDQTVRYVLDQHDPALAPVIAARGRARRDAENQARAAATRGEQAEAAARERARAAEAGRPPCRRATPALWALRSRPEVFARLGVRGEPETEAEARVAIGLAGELRGVGDVSVSMAISLAGART